MKETLRIGKTILIYEVIKHHWLGENLFDIGSQRAGYVRSFIANNTTVRLPDNEGDLIHMTINRDVKLCGYYLKVKSLK